MSEPAPPYAFVGAYGRCYMRPDEAIDKRHVYLLFELLRSWPFESALELGSWLGASATAFVEAMNRGDFPRRTTLCDVKPTASLMQVARECLQRERLCVTRVPSALVLARDEPYDCILVDANHDLPSVSEELRELRRRRPLCVLAHDTCASAAGYERAEGAALLGASFASDPGYFCLEDAVPRPGERTERGFLLATTSEKLYEVARGLFARWCPRF